MIDDLGTVYRVLNGGSRLGITKYAASTHTFSEQRQPVTIEARRERRSGKPCRRRGQSNHLGGFDMRANRGRRKSDRGHSTISVLV